jgi:nicotinamide mononucleotide transporter
LTVLSQVIEQARAQSVPELIAVIAAIAYLGFAIRQQIICWFFAAISTSIYIWLFIEARLYMESVLNLFYLLTAGYGWWVWSGGRDDGDGRPVVIWAWRRHLTASVVVVFLSALSGWTLSVYSDAAYPYIDSMTTWFAIWATFLVARKVLENWWYWLLIDLASIFIYWTRDLQLTALLFVIYVIMIPFGLISWRNSMREHGDNKLSMQ